MLRNDFSCILGGRSMPIPDLAAVRQDRWDKAVRDNEWVIGSPELVIELASPSKRKLNRKVDEYLEHGAEAVWIIYPVTKTFDVITTHGAAEARIGETLEFHGVQVPVASLFKNG